MTTEPVHGHVRFIPDFPVEEVMYDLWRVLAVIVPILWTAVLLRWAT